MIVYTGGTFDCFHAGHVNFLRNISEFGDVVVALNTDEFIEEFKGRRPIMSYDERKAVLESCKYVKRVVKNVLGSDSKPTITGVGPDVIAVGTDWLSKDYMGQLQVTEDYLRDKDIVVMFVPYTQGISTTDIRKRLDEASNSGTTPH